MEEDERKFPETFHYQAGFGQRSSNAYFGTDVLSGLTAGMDEFLSDPEGRWRQFRSLGAAVLGCVPWLDDQGLLSRIDHFPSACVVVTKQELKKRGQDRFERLKQYADRGSGFPADVFAEMTGLVSRYDGPPPVIGPYTPLADELRVPTIRSFGFRKAGKRPVPLIHAKMFLLGHLWWHDEDGSPSGVADVTGFTPKRLWLGSTNGTKSSRLGLEFGVWLDDPDLLADAQQFLVKVMRSSETIDPDDDLFEPEYINVKYDDDAFYEAMSDSFDALDEDDE
ncbi:hypothetical protein [Streptomyces xanthochromogenes]|uniref:hypothetical protein n=1 Tax=Streptomyces xanthochromogenes TaxID=67384 RepID=UPI002F414087